MGLGLGREVEEGGRHDVWSRPAEWMCIMRGNEANLWGCVRWAFTSTSENRGREREERGTHLAADTLGSHLPSVGVSINSPPLWN